MISASSLRFRLPLLALGVALLSLTAACDRKDKDDAAPIEELATTSEDHATAENDDAALSDLAEQDLPIDLSRAITTASPAAERRSVFNGSASTCATRTWTPATTGIGGTLVVDFGTGCVGIDGRTRSGQLTAVFVGQPNTPNATITITRQNYFVNGNQHMGTKTITFTDYNAWHVVVAGGQINFADGRTASWICDRHVTRTATVGQPTTFVITGTASGTNRKGNIYSAAIDDAHPLVKRREVGCYNVFVDGILTVMNSTKDRRAVLNYNPTGATPAPCDNVATVAVNGGTPRQITVR